MANNYNQHSDKKSFKDSDTEQRIMDRASAFNVPAGRPKEEVLLLLKSRIAEKEKGNIKSGRNNFRLVFEISSIAAGILLLFGLWHLLAGSVSMKVIADKGMHKEYKLPDGSDVSLNADSKISFDKKNFISDRHINLDGEAFFNIKEGNTFTISTKNGDIKVLGTSFNVYNRDNAFKVSCLTGKILVTAGKGSAIIIPGETAQLSGDNLVSFNDKNLNSVTGWMNGEFYFENSHLSLVFDEIERQFNVKFETNNINKYFTGSFTNKDLESALEIVCIPMGLNYEIGRDGKISVNQIRK